MDPTPSPPACTFTFICSRASAHGLDRASEVGYYLTGGVVGSYTKGEWSWGEGGTTAFVTWLDERMKAGPNSPAHQLRKVLLLGVPEEVNISDSAGLVSAIQTVLRAVGRDESTVLNESFARAAAIATCGPRLRISCTDFWEQLLKMGVTGQAPGTNTCSPPRHLGTFFRLSQRSTAPHPKCDVCRCGLRLPGLH